MSNDRDGRGGKELADIMLAKAKELLEEASAAEGEQLHLLDAPTPEEMAIAQAELGPNAGRIAVLQHARKAKRGRTPGSRNKRTVDFAKFLLQHGRHPAITMMEIQATPPEMLVERSRQMDPTKRQLSYGDAQSLRVRCAEALMPYLESKKPVAADINIRGVMVREEIGEIRRVDGTVIDGGILGVASDIDPDGEAGE